MIALFLLALSNPPINRHAVVSRHNVVLTKFEGERPLQVGNGEFAYGMDITGMQTLVPFNTMSQWGWHSSALPPGVKIEDFQGQTWDTHGRPIRYPMFDPDHPEISEWLAGNPHRINLGRVGLNLKKADGTDATVADLKQTRQELDLWTGTVKSHFVLEGQAVDVTTACHPGQDTLAFRVESPLVKMGLIQAFVTCPGNDPQQFANFVGDWSHPAKLEEQSSNRKNEATFLRRLDDDSYYVGLSWQGDARLRRTDEQNGPPIQIVSARYGARDKWLDVTTQAKELAKSGRFQMHASNDLGPEPIHGVVKALQVVYRSGGKDVMVEARENDDVIIDPFADHRRLTLLPGNSDELAFTCSFSKKPIDKLPDASTTFAASRKGWLAYWQSGGAIDLSGSTDPRWKELERRIVLSQYLMKVNEAGSLPPQESGLVNNGWFGRFHMEMAWWHMTHWALWNRWPELNRGIGIYDRLLPTSTKLAKSEGYEGARWPKCIGPNMVEWPHEIHSLLIWQQPHPIFFAELDYRAHPTKATLEKWRPVVDATADFMSTYAFFDKPKGKYVLGPPVVLASENTNSKTTENPTFELGYWRFGLRTASEWRKRLGLPVPAKWSGVLRGLSPLPVQDGVYVLHEDVKDMWTKWNFEHPALTAAYGLLPGDGVDEPTMRRTLDMVSSKWNFARTWGWDYPMLAMCAARLGEPDKAIDFLLTSSAGFQFDERGLATGGPMSYFPSNGGLLYAVAMLSAGWMGSSGHAPGFPSHGRWKVRWEGLSQAL